MFVNSFQFGPEAGWLPWHLETIPIAVFFMMSGVISTGIIASIKLFQALVLLVVCVCVLAIMVKCDVGFVDVHFGRMDILCYFGAIGGIGATICFSKLLVMISPIRAVLSYIGENSLYYFASEYLASGLLFAVLSFMDIHQVNSWQLTCWKLMILTLALFPIRFVYKRTLLSVEGLIKEACFICRGIATVRKSEKS